MTLSLLPTESDPVRVVEGDCLRVLADLPDGCIDAVITDPPYGMNWDTNSKRFSGGYRHIKRGAGRDDWRAVKGDDRPFDPSPWLGFPRVVLFGSNHYAARLPVGTTLVWVKRNDAAFGSFLSDAEVAWMKGGHGVYCRRDLSMSNVNVARSHPTQKPVSLMKWILDKAKVPLGGLVLDPYAGSGTTAVACVLTGRRCLAVEIDPHYAAIARARVAAAMGRGPGSLFAGVE